MAKAENKLEDVKFEVRWHGKPHGLLERLLTKLHLNFTDYEITKDELIIKTGFFKQITNTTFKITFKTPAMLNLHGIHGTSIRVYTNQKLFFLPYPLKFQLLLFHHILKKLIHLQY